MVPGIMQMVLRSVKFYKKPVLYQVLIIALLSAVITGSLLTGKSVRTSLKRSATERLGNTGILISSGIRYFDAGLVDRMKDSAEISCTGILEINGYCQSLNSQKGAFNTHVYGITSDFFTFHDKDTLSIKPGYVAVNKRLADYLGLKQGDDLIIRFREISDIPADAPFASEKDAGKSVVMKVGTILNPAHLGNFSLSISQIMPMNVFMNLSDLNGNSGNVLKMNRLLIDNNNLINKVSESLKKILKPIDIGLKLRKVKKTGEVELTSDRIFIDGTILRQIKNLIPSSAPLITYLGNRFTTGTRFTPYSFISALPPALYPEIPQGNGIIIDRWMADDLVTGVGDTLQIYWYSPDSLNKLIESSSKFIIKRIVDMQGIWSDSLLMPDFPGIAGSESCSDWDAGVPIKMNEIRRKDEDYWNKYRGTPKAFINYEKGAELWGNNFGPATAVRFPVTLSENEIDAMLKGSLDPGRSGFTVVDLEDEAVKAANESVDFGTLFLSLGFFLILASVVLLSFAVSSYFDSKRDQLKTLFALGFNNRWVRKLLFLESGLISFIGCLTGAFAGYFVNVIITGALNSVWRGAVQTDTLSSFFSFVPIITGFVTTILIIIAFMMIKIRNYLKMLNRKEKEIHSTPVPGRNFLLLLISATVTVSLFVLSIIYKDQELSFSFAAGTLLLITFILFWRQYYIGRIGRNEGRIKLRKNLSRLYYSFYPSHAVTPILFIAAGIFAVFITGANKMTFNENHLKRSGGTGGYLLWCENTIPVKEDLNTVAGRKKLGIADNQLAKMTFVQAKRSSGNDASCLNLNHITSPPLLGINPADFISKGSFSFAKSLNLMDLKNPWQFLEIHSSPNIIYGIADQTVLEWGLKLKLGDTLIMRAENGQPLKIILAAGLKSSVFQGYVVIGMDNFMKYFPSVSGSSVLLVDGDPELTDIYESTLNERLANYGINIEKTTDRLAAFYQVTNTYLSVFGVLGAFGMIIGIAGLGFVLLRNYNQRKREFALLLATGFSFKAIRKIIFSEQVLILCAGVSAGAISAIIATLPSIKESPDIPWLYLILMVLSITLTGLVTLVVSVWAISADALTASLKKE